MRSMFDSAVSSLAELARYTLEPGVQSARCRRGPGSWVESSARVPEESGEDLYGFMDL